MKTYPIIMSGPMIRTLLEGRKTQTRRLAWSDPSWPQYLASEHLEDYELRGWKCEEQPTGMFLVRKPTIWHKVKPGDLLWVRENFCDTTLYASVNKLKKDRVHYAADGKKAEWRYSPSIHMPRWASRLTLEVADVCLQRLQDISEEDAIAEGASSRPSCFGCGRHAQGWSMDWSRIGSVAEGSTLSEADIALGSARSAFGNFINGLHDKDWHIKNTSSLWEDNPEVIALTFRVHHIGTEIYYAGDIANQPGFGKITQLNQNPRFGATYDIELEDGRELRGIPTIMLGNEYHGHHGTRFVTRAAYDAYWKERAETPAWFHGIEHMTLEDDGYLRWKGQTVERFDPDFAQTDAAKGKARILAARCRHLEEIGEPVNKKTVVLTWGEKVRQSVSEGRER